MLTDASTRPITIDSTGSFVERLARTYREPPRWMSPQSVSSQGV